MTSFRELHRPGDPFVLANAWDVGSAKVLAALGAKAIATSSAAHAFTLGRPDGGTVTRDEALSHAEDLVAAVDVPVSGDFENGFGPSPDDCAETVKLSAEIRLAGICIEDAALPHNSAYDFDLAVERIAAASAAARALPGDFVFCARADGVMNGHYDIDEALRRVAAFDAAGADVIYVPLPETMDDLSRVIAATPKPVNVLVAGPYANNGLAHYAAMGAARLSLGSALARVAQAAMLKAGRSAISGDFHGLSEAARGSEVDALLR